MPAPPLSNENNSNKVIFLSDKKKNTNSDIQIFSYLPSMIYLDYHGDRQANKQPPPPKKKSAHNLLHFLETKLVLTSVPLSPTTHCLILSTTLHHAYTNTTHTPSLSNSSSLFMYRLLLVRDGFFHVYLFSLGPMIMKTPVAWVTAGCDRLIHCLIDPSFCISVWPHLFKKSTADLFFQGRGVMRDNAVGQKWKVCFGWGC